MGYRKPINIIYNQETRLALLEMVIGAHVWYTANSHRCYSHH